MTRRDFIDGTPLLHAVVGSACAYEILALSTGKVPTLSQVCRKFRAFEILMLGVLLAHLHIAEKEMECLISSSDSFPATFPQP